MWKKILKKDEEKLNINTIYEQTSSGQDYNASLESEDGGKKPTKVPDNPEDAFNRLKQPPRE